MAKAIQIILLLIAVGILAAAFWQYPLIGCAVLVLIALAVSSGLKSGFWP